MDHVRTLKALCVGLSAVGLLVPSSVVDASTPVTLATAPKPVSLVADAELDSLGFLHGRVFSARGVPAAGVTVVLRQTDRELARTDTDALGRFRLGQLRGGTYELSVGAQGRLVRAWAANTAPPAAGDVVVILGDGEVVRGQMPLEEFFASDAVLLIGLVAAMIAIPVAIHNSKPSSP
ncbi:MAG: carboxypeptidase-like regulatory domain-containing protein [Planctomycetota bacterium]